MNKNIKILFSFFFVFLFALNSHAQFEEHFSDGGFNANPNWDGSESQFSVNGERKLVLNGDSDNGAAYLSTPNSLKENVSFEFYIKLDFQPTTNDFARIYLMSNNNDLLQSNDAYLLQINEEKSLQFVKQNSNNFSVLLTMLNNQFSTGLDGQIKVIKYGSCKWVFYYKPLLNDDYIALDSIVENTDIFINNYFGIVGNYTINSKSKFFFDDFIVSSIDDGTTNSADTLSIKRIKANIDVVQLQLNKKVSENIELQMDRFLVDEIAVFKSIRFINDTTLELIPTNNLEKNKIYQLNTKHVNLCSVDNSLDDSLLFAITDIPQKNEILINEVMFEADKGEFVEFYNSTNKLFQLRDISYNSYDPITQVKTESLDFIDKNYFIQPNDYFVLIANPSQIKSNYTNVDDKKIIETGISSLNDDEGIIGISNTKKQEIDRFRYNTNWHSSLLVTTKNVSLERVSAEAKTQDKYNWFSANKTANYATPTQKNSVDKNLNFDEIKIEPEVFSPNQDGVDDVLNIVYTFEEASSLSNLSIYNTEGRIIKTLLSNEILPQKGFVIWDGTDENGNKAGVGIYFLVMETILPSGRKIIFKEKCVLATHLN